MTEHIARPGLRTVVCLARDTFGHHCARYLAEVAGGTVAIAANAEEVGRLLSATGGAGLLLAPARAREVALDQALDQAVRTVGAQFLPVTLSSVSLTVGPLLGAGRSCHRCWRVKEEENGREGLKLSATQGPPAKAAAFLAVGIAAELTRVASLPFSSPLWRLDLSTGHASWGTLISSPQCLQCTRALWQQRGDGGSQALEQLILRLLPD